jgi:hypothetical protein
MFIPLALYSLIGWSRDMDSLTIEETDYKIKVMTAHRNGESIQYRVLGDSLPENWHNSHRPDWSWVNFDYRIEQTPASIDWSNLSPVIKFIACNQDYSVGFATKPFIEGGRWVHRGRPNETLHVDLVASFKRGNMDWKESLIERPRDDT